MKPECYRRVGCISVPILEPATVTPGQATNLQKMNILRAGTYGTYCWIRDLLVTSGSFIGAWLWHLGPRVNFWAAAVCGALGTL